MAGVLSAEEALRRIRARSLQGHESDALRQAGRKKLEEYRKLKASLVGDIEKKLTSFTATTPPLEQQQSSSADADPMVDLLLEQVSSLMADRQRLQLQCSTLQRENEQLTELVGYLSLSLEQQQDQEQQELQEGQPLPSISDEQELEGDWYAEQDAARDEPAVPTHSSSLSSMDAAYPAEDDSITEALQ